MSGVNEALRSLLIEVFPTVDDWLARFGCHEVIAALLTAAYGIEPKPGIETKKMAMAWLDEIKAHSEKTYEIHATEIMVNAEYKGLND